MAKNAATEGALGELHETLARVLTQAISEEDAPAAILAVAAKFLKDNDITCAVDETNAMGQMKSALDRNRAPRKVEDDALTQALDSVTSLEEYRNGVR